MNISETQKGFILKLFRAGWDIASISSATLLPEEIIKEVILAWK